MTNLQKTKLQKLIKEIKESVTTAAINLKIIHDEKLYLDSHESFEAFCKETFHFEERQAYRMLEFAEIKLSPIGDKIKNAAQAKAIADVPEDERENVLEKAEASGGITAASIAKAAEKSERVIELDRYNRIIPEDLLPDWNRSIETAQALVSSVQNICNTLSKGVDEGDLIFREISQSVVSNAKSLRYSIKAHMPAHVVCPFCNGKNREKCDACQGRGFVSKYFWEGPAVSQKMRDLIEKKS